VDGTFVPFAGFGPVAKAKFLVLGPPCSGVSALMDRLSSLKISEHVSPARLKGPGISRRTVSSAAEEVSTLALMRRWFFSRKPDAGFVLTDFPATLLQARVLDEWLEARGEDLSAVFAVNSAPEPVVAHYRMLGLLREVSLAAPP